MCDYKAKGRIFGLKKQARKGGLRSHMSWIIKRVIVQEILLGVASEVMT
jgi:hypothetical protein